MSFRVGLIRTGRILDRRRFLIHNNGCTAFSDVHTPSQSSASPGGQEPTSLKGPSLGYQGSPQVLQTLQRELRHALLNNDPPLVHQLYRSFRDNARNMENIGIKKPNSPELEKLLFDVVDFLAGSMRQPDLALVEEVLSDLPVVFGVVSPLQFHNTIVRALLRRGDLATIYQWLMTLVMKRGGFVPTLEHWHLFLQSCIDKNSTKMLLRAIASMSQSGCTPTNVTYTIVFHALAPTGENLPRFRTLIAQMKEARLSYEKSISDLLYLAFLDQGYLDAAWKIRDLYELSLNPSRTTKDPDWNIRLSAEAEFNGVKAALELCQQFRRQGMVVSDYTLTAILQHSASLRDLRRAEKMFAVRANAAQWSLLIRNAVWKGDIPTALVIYEESQKAGIPTDAAMVSSLISELCRGQLRHPSERAIDRALQIYEDLSHQPPNPTKDGECNPHLTGPNAYIFHSLLRALGSSKNVVKYLPIATSLIDDMRTRNIPLDSSMSTTSLIVLLMRASSNFPEAFNVYRRLTNVKGSPRPDQDGYAAILHAYSKLPIGVPRVQDYFEIVKDMRAEGYGVTSKVYHFILRQLASLATAEPSNETMAHIVLAIRRVHDHLNIDPFITPNVSLWNQLMDSYQRAKCFREAHMLWDTMFISGRFSDASVNIIFDACGFAGARHVAAHIYSSLSSAGCSLTQENWKAWVECLCRLGHLDEAIDAVMEMNTPNARIPAQEDCVQIICKFAARYGREDEIHYRMEREFPTIWKSRKSLCSS